MPSVLRTNRTAAVLSAIFVLILGKAVWSSRDEDSAFLVDRMGAQWVQLDEPVDLGARGRETPVILFRKRFVSSANAAASRLTVYAMRDWTVSLDGKLAIPLAKTFLGWKRGRTVALPALSPGEHELLVAVINQDGPAVLMARSSDLGVYTDSSWQASRDGANWSPAEPVQASRLPDVAVSFGGPGRLVGRYALGLAALFTAAFFWSYAGSRLPNPDSSTLRWALIAAWAVMGVNNMLKLPLHLGFDAEGHLEYILYAASHWRVPFVFEGWEMQQPPLYYFLSAAFYTVLRLSGLAALSTNLLRVIPMACGAAQVEAAYRAGKIAFPHSGRLRAVVVVLGGLMPINLYLSQAIGNDPLAGVLSAWVLLEGMSLAEGRLPEAPSRLIRLGTLLGLALLTKATAVLLIPVIALPLFKGCRSWRPIASRFLRVFGVAFLISGWFYVRNYIVLGRFYVGAWDPASHLIIWKYPGYWTWGHLLRFGRALSHPIFASTAGYWDSLYSTWWLDGCLSARYDAPPPWNYGPMIMGAWLALVPALAVVLGTAVAAIRGRTREAVAFSAQSAAIFLCGWFLLFELKVPEYSDGRYLLGVLPCVAVLGGAGLEWMTSNDLAQSLISAWLSCWAVFAYMAYFVV